MNSFYKRHFTFTEQEKTDYIITGAVLGIILFFFNWRTTSYTLTTGIGNFLLMLLASFLVLGLFVGAGKFIALKKNYTAEYMRWTTGLLIGVILGFISRGALPLFFPGFLELRRIKRLSHGDLYSGENKGDIFFILAGTLWIIMLAGMLFLLFYTQTEFIVFQYIYVLCGFLCIFSVLPVKSNIGIHIFYVARKKYYFLLCISVVFGILLIIGTIYALIVASILGVILGALAKRNPLESTN